MNVLLTRRVRKKHRIMERKRHQIVRHLCIPLHMICIGWNQKEVFVGTLSMQRNHTVFLHAFKVEFHSTVESSKKIDNVLFEQQVLHYVTVFTCFPVTHIHPEIIDCKDLTRNDALYMHLVGLFEVRMNRARKVHVSNQSVC